jgi:hypothetical protein
MQRRCKTSEVEGFAIVYRERERDVSLFHLCKWVVFHSAPARVTSVCNRPCVLV